MARILFLSHRVPYPPDKGDKIRSYHLLRHLASRNEVHLAAFIDDPVDRRSLAPLSNLCQEVKLFDLNPRIARVRAGARFLGGRTLSQSYFDHDGLRRWVVETIDRSAITHALTFSSSMAGYVSGPQFSHLRRIADFCDVDSDKWRQYALRSTALLRWVYSREASRLLSFEREIASEFDAVLFASREEADLFGSLAPECARTVSFFDNGVDARYFDPSLRFESPFDGHGSVVALFTGVMDYWPNVDAVCWFVDNVWPKVRSEVPDARFFIVGSRPSSVVRALQSREGVYVTGRVEDVRPYLAHANAVVAPLRIARGIQNKVLEALAMARPVVCTSAAMESVRAVPGAGLRVEDEPMRFAAALLESARLGQNAEGRQAIMKSHDWSTNLAVVDELVSDR